MKAHSKLGMAGRGGSAVLLVVLLLAATIFAIFHATGPVQPRAVAPRRTMVAYQYVDDDDGGNAAASAPEPSENLPPAQPRRAVSQPAAKTEKKSLEASEARPARERGTGRAAAAVVDEAPARLLADFAAGCRTTTDYPRCNITALLSGVPKTGTTFFEFMVAQVLKASCAQDELCEITHFSRPTYRVQATRRGRPAREITWWIGRKHDMATFEEEPATAENLPELLQAVEPLAEDFVSKITRYFNAQSACMRAQNVSVTDTKCLPALLTTAMEVI